MNAAAALARDQVLRAQKQELEERHASALAQETTRLQEALRSAEREATKREAQIIEQYQQASAATAVEHQSQLEQLQDDRAADAAARDAAHREAMAHALSEARREAQAEAEETAETLRRQSEERMALLMEQQAAMTSQIARLEGQANKKLQEAVAEAQAAASAELLAVKAAFADEAERDVTAAVALVETDLLGRFAEQKAELEAVHARETARIREEAAAAQQKERDTMKVVLEQIAEHSEEERARIIAAHEAELAHLAEVHATELENHKAQHAALQSERDSLLQARNRLSDEHLAHLQAQQATFASQIAAVREDYAQRELALQTELQSQLTQSNSEYLEKIAAQAEFLTSQKDQELANLQATLAASCNAEREAALADFQSQLETQMQACNEKVATVEEKFQSLLRETRDLRETLHETEDLHHVQLQAERANAAEALRTATAEQHEKARREWQEKVQQMEEAHRALVQQNQAKLAQQSAEHASRVAELQRQRDEALLQVAELQHRVESLTSSNSNLQEKIAALQQNVDE